MSPEQVGRIVLTEAGAMGVIDGAFGVGIGWLISNGYGAGHKSGEWLAVRFYLPSPPSLLSAQHE